MVHFVRDLKDAVRSLKRNLRFTGLVVLTLALGIGGNTAILAVAETVFFAPLPFPASERLVRIRATNTAPGSEQNAFNLRGGEIQVLERQGELSPFSAIVAFTVQNRTLTANGVPERVSVCALYGGWQAVLGIPPAAGRWFSAEEERRGDQSGAALISSAMWKSKFGGDPAILGKSIPLDNRSHVIIGVMPEGFRFPYYADFWTPTTMVVRSVDDYAVVGRLKSNVTIAGASHALDAVAKTLVQQFPNIYSGSAMGLRLWPLREDFVGDQKPESVAIAAVGGFFLLLASFNVASLLLVRSVTRRKEMQIRAALGASRGRLIRRSLAETLVLAVAGGAIGLLLANQINPYLADFVPPVLTRQLNMAVRGAGLFSFGAALFLSLLTAAASGLLPAITSASITPEGVNRESARTTRNRRERFWMDAFVVLEFALAIALIGGAGLMLRNLSALTRRDLGIDARHILTMRISTTDPRYSSTEARLQLVKQVVANAEEAPGVAAVGISTANPLGGTTWTAPIAVEGHAPQNQNSSFAVNHRLVTARLFESMGIRLLQGRSFTEEDTASTPGVAIVSLAMAHRFWPNSDPIGKRVRVNRVGQPWLQVVGVVSDVEDFTGGDGPRETWYLPYAQHAATPAASDLVLMVRSIADPTAILHGVEQSVHRVNQDLALYDAAALDRYYLDSLRQQRNTSILISLLAGFGLLLGALGIYGTLSLTVGERVREIGIRMALGASRSEILNMIMKQGLRLSLMAAVLGLGAAWALGRVLSSQLSVVQAGDPGSLLAALVILFLAACFAMYWPARRAASLDPVEALRV